MGFGESGTWGKWDLGKMGFEVSRILEKWENGNLGKWDFGRVGFLKIGILGKWDFAMRSEWREPLHE